MKKIFTTLVSCFLICSLTGCLNSWGGVKFQDRPINLPLNADMLGRSLFKEPEVVRRHLEEVPGIIAIDDGSGNLQATLPLIVGGFVPPVIPIKDEKAFYQSIIDRSAGVQGSYLALLSASLDAKQTAEVMITETAEAHIPNDKVPWQKIVDWVKEHPAAPGQKRYYVKTALLSAVAETLYSEVKSDATVDGSAFGAKGKVYATNKQTQASNVYYIGAYLLDVDLIAQNPPGRTPPNLNAYEVKQSLIFKTLLQPK